MEEIPIGPGIPLGIEVVTNPGLGFGGAYGTWGNYYDNNRLPSLVEERLGRPLDEAERLSLAELGFVGRHHLPRLSPVEATELEVRAGARFLAEAARANGWQPADVDAVLIGMSVPATGDYLERATREAGIPEKALKVSIHKACDGSVAGLNLALNPALPTNRSATPNLAEALFGKRVLIGGIEGLSRVLNFTHDLQAMQLFGTAAGIIGVVPGQTMKFLVGGMHEVYDVEGMLQLHMAYPHSRVTGGESMIEVTHTSEHSMRVAGLMHEPADTAETVCMAGPMGMVKLFVRNGVIAVREVVESYRQRMAELAMPGKDLTIGIVHHANLKINQLKGKYLAKEGINVPMPWLLSEFGNVSAASNMIAFLRALAPLKPGDHVLFDGFGAGTYYDVLAVELG
jgi:hypothetical protein